MTITRCLYSVFVAVMLEFFIASSGCFAARLYPEKLYQNLWCDSYGGIAEFLLPDNTRVDCVLSDYAIEFDFANKWSEAIGQSLYYGYCLNKTSAIVLIMENYESDKKYLTRLNKIASLYGIKVWTIGPDYVENFANTKIVKK